MTKEWLEVRVDVDFLILRVLVVVQACAITHVSVLELKFHNVREHC